jgi:hypothetical protein
MTNILLIIAIAILGLNCYLTYKQLVFLYALEPQIKERIEMKFKEPENIVMDWIPPESDEEIAFKESMKKLEEMRKI